MTTSLSDPRWSSGDPAADAADAATGPTPPLSTVEQQAPLATTPPGAGPESRTVAARGDSTDDPAAEDEKRHLRAPPARVNDPLRHARAAASSAVLHMAVLILMALLLISRPGNSGLLVELSPHESYGEDLEPGELDIALDLEELQSDQAPLESELVDLEQT